ncbi:MAG: ABC transporter ATP-binding protein [Treponema sp.]|nr:ABC transporter ATP-binding protein [Treponema sp.]
MKPEGLRIRGLARSFAGGFRLSIGELDVSPGETLVLAGPSGCGKTSALNLIAGLLREDSGTILLDGEDVAALPPWKRGMAVVFQDLALFPHLSVGGNVGYGPFLRGLRGAERRQIVAGALRAVRLPGWEKRRVETLSGGERQRVAIARALAAEPRLLLLDEPFSSLDAPLRREIQGEFASIRARSAAPCIFVTHDREEAALLGNRIALMDRGRIVETGTGRELFLEPKTAFAGRFFGRGTVLPREKLSMPGSGLVFVPRDALRRIGSGSGSEKSILRARFLRAACEGGMMNLELELPDGTRIGAEQSLREPLSAPGSVECWELQTALLRPVEETGPDAPGAETAEPYKA